MERSRQRRPNVLQLLICGQYQHQHVGHSPLGAALFVYFRFFFFGVFFGLFFFGLFGKLLLGRCENYCTATTTAH